jgi:hypothetical protein
MTMHRTKGLTVGDVFGIDTVLPVEEAFRLAGAAKRLEAEHVKRLRRAETLRAKYRKPAMKTKSLPPRTAETTACHCGGRCGPCETETAFNRCHELSQRLEMLDALPDLAASQLRTSETLRKVKGLLANLEGKSIDASVPTIEELQLRIRLLGLQDERDRVWNELTQRGCAILRQDRVRSS